MLEYIKNHKVLFFIVSVIIYYLLICNICANTYYHLTSDEKVDKVVVISPTNQEVVITSGELIEKVNRQFHMQLLFSLKLDTLKKNSKENFSVIFYNNKDKELKGFSYDLETKKIYPGDLKLPQKTQLVIDKILSYVEEQQKISN